MDTSSTKSCLSTTVPTQYSVFHHLSQLKFSPIHASPHCHLALPIHICDNPDINCIVIPTIPWLMKSDYLLLSPSVQAVCHSKLNIQLLQAFFGLCNLDYLLLEFHTSNPHNQMCWCPITLWLVEPCLSTALAILPFHCFGNTNNKMHWQSYADAPLPQRHWLPLCYHFHHSMVHSIPTIYGFSNPDNPTASALPKSMTLAFQYSCGFGIPRNQLFWRPHHYIAPAIPDFLCFCNPNFHSFA